MPKRLAQQGIDLYLAGVAAWAAAWTLFGDRKGALALLNAWAFWLLGPALPVGAARLWTVGRRAREAGLAGVAADLQPDRTAGVGQDSRLGPRLAAIWLLAGGGLLAHRYRWLPYGLFAAVRQALRLQRRDAPVSAGHPLCGIAPGSPSAAGARPGMRKLRVLSFNALMENDCPDSVLDLVRRENADVVLMQELEPGMNHVLWEGLEGFDYCHWERHHRPGGSFGFFSRYPFEVTGVWDFPATRPYAARITLDLPGGPVDLYNLHLLSIGPKAMSKTGLDGNFRVREEQAESLADEMAARTQPALAMGDCNMTEGNTAYYRAGRRLKDAWLAAGHGPGWTWPRRWGFRPADESRRTQPLLRLDYCFCSPSVKPVAMRVLYDDVGSDHCPIVVDALV